MQQTRKGKKIGIYMGYYHS
uniref:Uncharacterized protein n=1 Tax=Arundo donax TaxID=35708 RepID=A0A0A8YHN3_ARUDO